MYTKARLGGIAMKILILGAGALGSLMADELLRVGHEVTLLARGGRYRELKEQGLVVRHYLQLRTSRTKPEVVDKVPEGVAYDAAFLTAHRKERRFPVILRSNAFSRKYDLSLFQVLCP